MTMSRNEQMEFSFDASGPERAGGGSTAGGTFPAAESLPFAPEGQAPATGGGAPANAAPVLAPSMVPTPCPPSLPPGARWRTVPTEQQSIGFVLQRSRRRSIGFVVGDDGLRVTAPTWVTLAQIDEAVREKARWILAKLREWEARRQRLTLSHTHWRDGGELPYLGCRVGLRLGSAPGHPHAAPAADARARAAGAAQAWFSGDADAPRPDDALWLALPPDAGHARVRDTAQAWLQRRAQAWFDARLQELLARTGLTIRRWRLSSAATRWGSCSSDGSIMLNWRLIHFAPPVIDYVIAHELAHLREMNHSRDFWAEVGNILPDFEQARDTLRRHDPADIPHL